MRLEDKEPVAYKKKKPKQPLSERVINRLLSDDMMGIPDRLREEFLYPRLEDLGYELAVALVGMLFHREPRGGYSRRDRERRRDDDYRKDYSRMSESDRVPARSNRRPSYDLEQIIFRTRKAAEEALDEVKDVCDKYDRVTVARFYEAAHLSSNGYTDNYYGWTDLSRVDYNDIVPVDGGYMIDMPPAVKIGTR